MNPEPATCPNCGKPVFPNALMALCPDCLLRAGFATGAEAEGTVAFPPPAPEELAPLFPQLEILNVLGRGGMGVVYQVRQKSLNRQAALKLLAPERVGAAGFAARFQKEAHALAAMNHTHIVTVYDFGQAGGFYYLLMEFVDGVNLRQAMKAGRFTSEQALAVVPPVCEALQYAHEHGIVHRDIKPENLLLDKEGRVKIADFGIARILGEEATPISPAGSEIGSAQHEGTLTSVAGTPQYMAPEQKEHRAADHRVDIYALRVVLYELLTGELPADNLQPPSSRIRGVQIDVRLDEIVLRALEVNPELRYQSAGDFRTQVETVTKGSTKPPREPDPRPMPGSPIGEKRSDATFGNRVALGVRSLAGVAIFFAALSGILGLLAFALWPAPPQMLVWSLLVAALLGIGLAIPSRNTSLGKRALVVGWINTAIWVVIAGVIIARHIIVRHVVMRDGRDKTVLSSNAGSVILRELANPPPTDGRTPIIPPMAAEKSDRVTLERKLQRAREELNRQRSLLNAKATSEPALQAAEDTVAHLEAELTGDATQVARSELFAARRRLELAMRLHEARALSEADYEKAKNAAADAEANMQAVLATKP